MFRGRVIAPATIAAGIGAMLFGGTLIAAGATVWGALELAAGAIGVRLGVGLWRYQERQRRHGWPE
jgi:hypothetical protein